jgi:hypothetical protein
MVAIHCVGLLDDVIIVFPSVWWPTVSYLVVAVNVPTAKWKFASLSIQFRLFNKVLCGADSNRLILVNARQYRIYFH